MRTLILAALLLCGVAIVAAPAAHADGYVGFGYGGGYGGGCAPCSGGSYYPRPTYYGYPSYQAPVYYRSTYYQPTYYQPTYYRPVYYYPRPQFQVGFWGGHSHRSYGWGGHHGSRHYAGRRR